jgi:hypothetical protein
MWQGEVDRRSLECSMARHSAGLHDAFEAVELALDTLVLLTGDRPEQPQEVEIGT